MAIGNQVDSSSCLKAVFTGLPALMSRSANLPHVKAYRGALRQVLGALLERGWNDEFIRAIVKKSDSAHGRRFSISPSNPIDSKGKTFGLVANSLLFS